LVIHNAIKVRIEQKETAKELVKKSLFFAYSSAIFTNLDRFLYKVISDYLQEGNPGIEGMKVK